MYYNKGCNLTRSPRAQKRLSRACVMILRSGSRGHRNCLRLSRTPVAHAKDGVSRCPKDGPRQNINASSVLYRPRSLSVALARSRSISLSPSPDKSEPEVVGIASNPYRVHQTEYIRRQYCTSDDVMSTNKGTSRTRKFKKF